VADGGNSDPLELLGHAACFIKNIPGYDSSKSGYEMVDIDTSDTGTQKSPTAPQLPPSNSSVWERGAEQDQKHGNSLEM
jgi:hypothetical protein